MASSFQTYPIPPQNIPLVEKDGTINAAWYRFFTAVWQKSGLANPHTSLFTVKPLDSNARAVTMYVSAALSPNTLRIYNLLGDQIGTGIQIPGT